MRYRRHDSNSQHHSLHPVSSGREDLNDNAFDDPVPNWEE